MDRTAETALQLELDDGGRMRIQLIAPHTFRLTWRAAGSFVEPALDRYGILRQTGQPVAFTAERHHPLSHVLTELAELRADTRDGQLSLWNANGEELVRTVAAPVSQSTASIAFTLDEGETLYGLGDGARGQLQKRGHRVEMWINKESPYLPIPFVMSSRGWGLLLVTTLRHTFDLGCTDPGRMTIEIPDGDELDLFLFTGDGFGELLDRYTDLVGKPCLNPIWAYGLSFIHNGNVHAWEVLNEALKFRQAGIPCDLIVLDTGWTKQPDDGLANLEWHPERFPVIGQDKGRLPTFIDMLHKHGFKLGLKLACDYDVTGSEEQMEGNEESPASLGDYMAAPSKNAAKPKRADDADEWSNIDERKNVDKPVGSTKSWYEHLQPFTSDGVSVYIVQGEQQWEEHPDRRWANGMDDNAVHNMYPVLLSKQMHDGFLNQTKLRPFVVNAMAGYSGIQRFASTISGGRHQEREIGMAAVLEFGLSGHAHATVNMDLSTREGIHAGFLLTWAHISRWTDFWNPLMLQDPLKKMFHLYARLHYRLIPYLYSAAHHAVRTGFPIVRAMPLMFPTDANVQALNKQYMLGDYLLVAVYTERVYLPEGSWIDYWTGERYAGGQTVDYAIPEGAGGPLFVRAGAILPYWPEMDYVGQIKPDCLEVHLYPHQVSEATLYEDDGVSLDYLDGYVARTHLRCEAGERLTRIDISPRSGYYTGMPRLRSYDLVIHAGSRPVNVRLNGQPLPELKSRPRAIKTVGWRYHRQSGQTHLHVEASALGEAAAPLKIELHDSGAASRSMMPPPTPTVAMVEPDYIEEMERYASAAIALHLGMAAGDSRSVDESLAVWWEGKVVASAGTEQWRVHLLHGAQLAIRHVERRGWRPEDILAVEMETLLMLRHLHTPAQGLQLLRQLFGKSLRAAQRSGLAVQHPTIRQTIAFLDQHVAEKLSLYETAEQVGAHPAHLSRLFKKEMGQTFSEYVMRQRMELAKDLLEFGLSIRDAAALSGFQDVSYFSKCFEGCWGLSPASLQM